MADATFLFRSGRRARLDDAGPSEFLYGFAELARDGAPVRMLEEDELGLDRGFPRLLEAAAGRVAAITGVHPRVLLMLARHRRVLSRGGTLIATTHSLGLALAALRRLGLADQHVVVMTMGLVQAEPSPLRLRWLRWLLAGTTLAALSKPEAELLRARLGPAIRVVDFAFGVDLDFWTPGAGARDGEALSVGNDWNRDFETLVEAWRPEFPMLEIITSRPVATTKPNVRVVRGDWRGRVIGDEELRGRLQRARLVVVPVRETLQPSGQSAALQAMACARPVILSANRGCWDRPMLERHGACRFVPPGDPAALAEALAGLLADRDGAETMGGRARRMLEAEDVSARAMARQFRGLVPALAAAGR